MPIHSCKATASERETWKDHNTHCGDISAELITPDHFWSGWTTFSHQNWSGRTIISQPRMVWPDHFFIQNWSSQTVFTRTIFSVTVRRRWVFSNPVTFFHVNPYYYVLAYLMIYWCMMYAAEKFIFLVHGMDISYTRKFWHFLDISWYNIGQNFRQISCTQEIWCVGHISCAQDRWVSCGARARTWMTFPACIL